MAMNSKKSDCISDRVTTLINESIRMYNETKSGRTIKKITNYSITDDTFKWNIGDDTPHIEINFKGIKDLCKDQIYFVDLLIHYAFSLVNECTVDKSKTCDIDGEKGGINAKIKNMIDSIIKHKKNNNGSSPSK